jgi:hypothetical protein
MKKHYIYLIGLFALTMLGACDKNSFQVIDTRDVQGARIKFYNFAVGGPGVNFYGNNDKLTAVLSATGTEAVTGIAYGSVGPANNYALLSPGSYTFSGRIAAATDKDLVIGSINATLENGKFYSAYLSGIYDVAAKTSEAFIVVDNLPAEDNDAAYVRFVNGISNAPAMDVAVVPTTGNTTSITIGQAIAYKSASEFVKVPEGVYNLVCRNVSSSIGGITRADVSFVRGRVYTISSRGNMTVATGTTAPFLDNTINR